MSTETIGADSNPLSAIKSAAASDIGLRREENQDSFGIITSDRFKLFVVADGMGGVKGGGIASNLAVNVIKECLEDKSELTASAICAAVEHANAEIYEKGSADSSLAGMGTTYVGLGFVDTRLFISSVGDSRAYRIRDNHIAQLTTDHTLVQELLRSGAISSEQADNHPVSHMLTRSLGPGPVVEVDCWLCSDGPARGDIYVLCSDGLYNLVHDHEIAGAVQDNYIDAAVQKLVQLANERGGTDNITVIAIEVGEDFPVAPDAFEGSDGSVNGSGGHFGSNGSLDKTETEQPDSVVADAAARPTTEQVSTEAVLVAESPRIEERIPLAAANETLARSSDTKVAAEASVASKPVDNSNPHVESLWFLLRSRPASRALLLGGAFTFVTLIGFLGGFYAPRLLGGHDRLPVEVIAPEVPQAKVARLEPEFRAASSARRIELPPMRLGYQDNNLGSPSDSNGSASDSGHELGLSPDELSRVLRRKAALEHVVNELKEKIAAFDRPLNAKVSESLRSVREHRELLEGDEAELRGQIDVATRKLAVWYGRRKRLAATDPINLAAEVAVASPAVKEKKEIFELATWSYLKEAEVLRYNPSDASQEKKVLELAKARKDRQRELTEEVKRAIESEVADSDKSIAELTFKRDKVLGQIEEIRREEEYIKILMSGDSKGKDSKRRELSRERDLAQAELDELAHLTEPTAASTAADTVAPVQ